MDDTSEIDRTMIILQTQSYMYGFDENESHLPSMVALPVRADPSNVITEFYVVNVESSHNAIHGRSWLHMMKVIPSTYHQQVWYPTLTGTTDIRGYQAMSRTIFVIARKKFGLKPKITKAVSMKTSLRERNRSRLLHNSNHRATKAKILLFHRQKLQIAGRRRKSSCFMRTPIIQNEFSGSVRSFLPMRRLVLRIFFSRT